MDNADHLSPLPPLRIVQGEPDEASLACVRDTLKEAASSGDMPARGPIVYAETTFPGLNARYTPDYYELKTENCRTDACVVLGRRATRRCERRWSFPRSSRSRPSLPGSRKPSSEGRGIRDLNPNPSYSTVFVEDRAGGTYYVGTVTVGVQPMGPYFDGDGYMASLWLDACVPGWAGEIASYGAAFASQISSVRAKELSK